MTDKANWNPPSTKPDNHWHLLAVMPRDRTSAPYVILGTFDSYRGHWRTPMGALDGWLKVIGWMPLPEPPPAPERKAV